MDGFGQNSRLHVRIQLMFRNQFNLAPYEILQFQHEWNPLCEQIITTRKRNQHIDVASRSFLAAGHGTEYSDVFRSISTGQFKYFVAPEA